ncbi:hypothetical protein [Streptosporangium saharense]|uniref:hypothetical protein n=1 Tax=Streptosporangium saharense TaxID=1706840 RepID=UPI00367EDC20
MTADATAPPLPDAPTLTCAALKTVLGHGTDTNPAHPKTLGYAKSLDGAIILIARGGDQVADGEAFLLGSAVLACAFQREGGLLDRGGARGGMTGLTPSYTRAYP